MCATVQITLLQDISHRYVTRCFCIRGTSDAECTLERMTQQGFRAATVFCEQAQQVFNAGYHLSICISLLTHPHAGSCVLRMPFTLCCQLCLHSIGAGRRSWRRSLHRTLCVFWTVGVVALLYSRLHSRWSNVGKARSLNRT